MTKLGCEDDMPPPVAPVSSRSHYGGGRGSGSGGLGVVSTASGRVPVVPATQATPVAEMNQERMGSGEELDQLALIQYTWDTLRAKSRYCSD